MPVAQQPTPQDGMIVFAPTDLAHMQSIIDAVCVELDVPAHDHARREAIADRVFAAYSRGSRLPLNMVSAGLSEDRRSTAS